jgi:hypothetical protein
MQVADPGVNDSPVVLGPRGFPGQAGPPTAWLINSPAIRWTHADETPADRASIRSHGLLETKNIVLDGEKTVLDQNGDLPSSFFSLMESKYQTWCPSG